MYLKGIISKLPWEAYLDPISNEGTQNSGYIQNAEQNNNSIWNRIKKEDE